MSDARPDPYRGYKFKLEIDGAVQAAFHEAVGLHHEDAENDAARKMPGVHKSGDVTFKRGVIGDVSLLKWPVIDGRTQRKSGSIILSDEAGNEKTRWNFREGWPKKLDGPTLNAAANDLSIETLEFEHEGLTKA